MPASPAMEEAKQALSSLISSKRRSSGENWSHAFDMMAGYLERLGLDKELDRLKVIHIAGTKGKGSTAAFAESILRASGYTTGLFTSPHLIDVRERIRINGKLVSEDVFVKNFWRCFNDFQDSAKPDSPGMPAYFRFLTLLSLRIFLEERVDVVILEVGLGGRLDATNCIPHPVVCGIASLGFDHMDLLGHTLPEIAGEKAGIMKPGRPVVTVQQLPEAAPVLDERARQLGCPLSVAPSLAIYSPDQELPELGLHGAHQAINASLAVALARAWEAEAGPDDAARHDRLRCLDQGCLPPAYLSGLASVTWPGRGQVVDDPEMAVAGKACPLTFYLDGAHTAESTEACAEWFADTAREWAHAGPATTRHVLLFNCQEERSPENLLRPLATVLSRRSVPIHHALFVPPNSSYGKLGPRDGPADLAWQERLQAAWDGLCRKELGAASTSLGTAGPLALKPLTAHQPPTSAVLPSLQATLDVLRRTVRESSGLRLKVLITGSLYMVGDMLNILNIKNP